MKKYLALLLFIILLIPGCASDLGKYQPAATATPAPVSTPAPAASAPAPQATTTPTPPAIAEGLVRTEMGFGLYSIGLPEELGPYTYNGTLMMSQCYASPADPIFSVYTNFALIDDYQLTAGSNHSYSSQMVLMVSPTFDEQRFESKSATLSQGGHATYSFSQMDEYAFLNLEIMTDEIGYNFTIVLPASYYDKLEAIVQSFRVDEARLSDYLKRKPIRGEDGRWTAWDHSLAIEVPEDWDICLPEFMRNYPIGLQWNNAMQLIQLWYYEDYDTMLEEEFAAFEETAREFASGAGYADDESCWEDPITMPLDKLGTEAVCITRRSNNDLPHVTYISFIYEHRLFYGAFMSMPTVSQERQQQLQDIMATLQPADIGGEGVL